MWPIVVDGRGFHHQQRKMAVMVYERNLHTLQEWKLMTNHFLGYHRIYIYMYVYIYIHTYIHTYIQTYRQTDRHTYIHLYSQQCVPLSAPNKCNWGKSWSSGFWGYWIASPLSLRQTQISLEDESPIMAINMTGSILILMEYNLWYLNMVANPL